MDLGSKILTGETSEVVCKAIFIWPPLPFALFLVELRTSCGLLEPGSQRKWKKKELTHQASFWNFLTFYFFITFSSLLYISCKEDLIISILIKTTHDQTLWFIRLLVIYLYLIFELGWSNSWLCHWVGYMLVSCHPCCYCTLYMFVCSYLCHFFD